jgi:hypothetical protein
MMTPTSGDSAVDMWMRGGEWVVNGDDIAVGDARPTSVTRGSSQGTTEHTEDTETDVRSSFSESGGGLSSQAIVDIRKDALIRYEFASD